MPERNLAAAVSWRTFPVGSGAASATVPLMVGTLGSGGKVALVAAGVHGDEGPWGALAISKLLTRVRADRLIGTIRVLPVANPLAMQQSARCAPLDQLDLNRCFPGNPAGSHTEMLAATITRHALEGADLVIDLHGGGSWAVNAFAFRFEGSEPIAAAIGAPLIVDHGYRNLGQVSLTTQARARGAQVGAVEMGGHSQAEGAWALRIAQGVERALVYAGVLAPDPELPAAPASIHVQPPQVLRPKQGGIFHPVVGAEAVGTIVSEGTVLGELRHPVTDETLEVFTAPWGRTALMLLRPMLCVLEAGAMTYVVAEADV